jgi:hypothetical protein
MANYQETTGTGTAWRRAKQVVINNDYLGPKKIMFFEEDVVVLGDRVYKTSAEMVNSDYDPTYLIPLRDPETGEKTGNVISQALLYQALSSLYVDLAEKRDIKYQQLASNSQNISPNINM